MQEDIDKEPAGTPLIVKPDLPIVPIIAKPQDTILNVFKDISSKQPPLTVSRNNINVAPLKNSLDSSELSTVRRTETFQDKTKEEYKKEELHDSRIPIAHSSSIPFNTKELNISD